MMKTMLATVLEKTVNTYLGLDTDTIQALATLQGKKIAVDITDWSLTLFCLPQTDGLQFTAEKPLQVDATIRGKLIGLLKMSAAKGDRTALFHNKIEFEGDADLGHRLQTILSQIDIDWEEHLSHFVGDQMAFRAGRIFQQTTAALKNGFQSIQHSVTDYVQEEKSYLPPKAEVNDFYSAIATLRDDVARAEARIHLLKQST